MVQPSRLSFTTQSRGLHHTHEIGVAPENRTLDAVLRRSGFRDRFLVYAGRAPSMKMEPTPGFEPGTSAVRSGACRLSVTPCGHFETGSSGWIRTNAAALTERHPTVRSPRILKWWTRTVTLRRLLCAKQPCCLLSLRALGNWRSVRVMLPLPFARQASALAD